MRILHINHDITVATGGPVNSMNSMIKIWLSAGHEVQVLALDLPGETVSVGGEVQSVPPSFPVRFSNSRAAADWLAQTYSTFDVVFNHKIWTAISMRSSLFLRHQKRPYVLVPHGSLEPVDVRKKSLLKKILGPLIIRKCLQGSSGVLCSAQREADDLITYGAKCRRIVLPWPVTPVHSQISRQEARQTLKIPESEFVILSLGRIDYIKGFPVLLPAFKRLLQVNSKARLLIVGPDTRGYTKVVEQMVRQLGLNGAVTFMPPVVGVEKTRLQRAADCFALPSLKENFGMALVESMQQGLPCVISNNVFICDEIEKGGAGLVCNYDEKDVFEALRKFSENPELRAQMSAAALRVARTFDPEVLKEKYLGMLQVVAQPK
jgi:glycosyltransferase involved in cell wall biosynthesis